MEMHGNGLVATADDRLLQKDVATIVIRGAQPFAQAEEHTDPLPINVYQAADIVVVRALIPGARLADIDLTLDQGVLRLSGRVGPFDCGDHEVTWYRRGIDGGRFDEVLTLPAPVDVDRVAATYTDGVLTILCPLAGPPSAKRIPIESRQSLLDRG
jgi:HSP20 family protein